MSHDLLVGDCLDVMRGMEPDSVDAIVTDPPYGLKFMGRAWDHEVPGVPFWAEALRVAKPGAHLVAFGGTRKVHRLTCAIEDAGWEIRDTLMWLHGQGFPKSLDVSKAIDAAAGVERPVVGRGGRSSGGDNSFKVFGDDWEITTPATDAAKQWDGWGTALKPAWENIVLARKPFSGTVAANVLEYGTGALNIDACRTDSAPDPASWFAKRNPDVLSPHLGQRRANRIAMNAGLIPPPSGRWPANVVLGCACEGEQHDAECAVAMLDEQSGTLTSGLMLPGQPRKASLGKGGYHGSFPDTCTLQGTYGDTGGASRFFYTAKASRAEREEGLEHLPSRNGGSNAAGFTEDVARGLDRNRPVKNNHNTVKPIALMRWLVRLVTPPNGLVLDPFAGSGTTGIAAALEGFRFIGIEQDEAHAEIARARIAHWSAQTLLPFGAA